MSDFSDLAELGELLAATRQKRRHRALIGAYLKSLPEDEIAIAARLIIGRIFPESDPRAMNLSGAAVGHAVEEVTGALMDWGAINAAVDFGDAIEKWLTVCQHVPHGAPLRLAEVYRTYEQIAEDTGPNSRERKQARLVALLRRASPLEAKYLVKHLIREMRVGVNELSLLDAIADAAGVSGALIRRANQVCGDVGEVARVALREGARGLERLSVRIGVPLKPMLAQSADDVADAFARIAAPPALEYKLDGVRVQIHKRQDQVWLFSRRLSDITASLPEIAEQVRRDVSAEAVILDGEVIALSEAGRPRPFQDVMRRVGREREVTQFQKEVPVRLFVFDVLAAGDEVFLDRPNGERWAILQRVKGSLEAVPRVVPRDVAEGEAFLRAARAAGHEGVLAKSLASPYVPGERGKHWYKIKPVITLDLVIVAAEWGYGRRTGWLSNLHLAALDAETGELMEVGKTFKGPSDEEFKALTEALLARKRAERGGVVWVEPSVVVEVAFNNVQRSPRYPSGVALRLARIVNFRPDKSPADIETVQYLRELMARERDPDAA